MLIYNFLCARVGMVSRSLIFWIVYSIILLIYNSPLHAQELEETRETLLDEGGPVVLQSIEIQVKGLSNKTILRNRLGVKLGQEFANLTEMRTILDIGFDKLKGTGYFKNDGIKYRLIIKKGRTPLPVHLEANFEDRWTIYPVAYPYYRTSTGYGIRGRLKWDNFLGLLGNVTFRLDATQVQNGNYGPDISFGLGLSTIKLSPDLGLNGSLKTTRDARTDGANWAVGAGIGASLSIHALAVAGINMGYSISNSASAKFGYTGKVRTRPYFSNSFSHSLDLSKTRSSWGGVLIQGYSISLSNSYSLDSDPGSLTGPQEFALEDIQINLDIKLSRIYFDMINFKGRAGIGKSWDFKNGTYNSTGYNYDVNSYNRGKRDDLITGNFIVYLNMDMALLVFSDSIVGDVLLSPFLDMSWANGQNGFILEDTALGSGLELIWAFRSLKLRFTFGFDLQKPELYTIAISTGFYF